MTNYPVEKFRKEKTVPITLRRLHGCENCDWVYTKCKHDGVHKDGICPERTEYLHEIACSIPKEDGVTVDDWLRAWSSHQGQENLTSLKIRRDAVLQQLEELERDTSADPAQLRRLQARYDLAHGQYERMFKHMSNFHDMAVSRNTVKKVEHTRKDESPSDFRKKAEEYIIDVDKK